MYTRLTWACFSLPYDTAAPLLPILGHDRIGQLGSVARLRNDSLGSMLDLSPDRVIAPVAAQKRG